ncbi:MAG: DNA topoisomerase [Candidatus Njordarchaeales archaeon]
MGKQITLDEFFRKSRGEKEKRVLRDKELTSMIKNFSLSDLIKEFKSKIKLPEIKDRSSKKFSVMEILSNVRKVIIVTEKPKVAQAIAKALGGGKLRKVSTKSGNIHIYDVYWNAKKLTIIPLKGHIMEYAPIDAFSGKWEDSDPRALINPSFLKEVIIEKDVAEILKRESMDADVLILATDADEEGANIGLEAYEIITKVKGKIPTYQMWFISLQPAELRAAFYAPIEPKWSWAYAVKARRIIDAMIGFSATRELTVAFRDITQSLRVKAFSIGRVQTPTLYLLFVREREIRNFKPKPYWILKARIFINGESLEVIHKDSPFDSERSALMIYEKVKDVEKGFVRKILVSKELKLPPTPLNTTKALTMINDILGISAYRAMKILEDLYLNGLITYPRTDTDKYPPNYDHVRNLRALQKLPGLGVIAQRILRKGVKLRRNGSRLIGDHLPITPIDAAFPRDKRLPTKQHQAVYEVIVRRYLSLFLEPAEIARIKLLISIGSELFEASGIQIMREGFYVVYPYDKPKEEIKTKLTEGQKVQIEAVLPPERKFTQPPSRLKESELIKLMETLGLGTKSTRPEHIETLISRHYVERKGKTLRITNIGWTIAEFLEKIWPDFVKPFFSAYVHSLMRNVMNEEMDWQEMIEHVRVRFLRLFDELRKNIGELKEELSKVSKQYIREREVMKCPKCEGPMIILPSKRGKVNILKCIECGFSTIVPKARRYIVQAVKCKICGSPILLLKRSGKADIYLCPICWREKGICSKCDKLETCEALKLIKEEKEKNTVGKCECGGNLIYLINWRIVRCDNCGKKYYLPKQGSIRLLNKKCPRCNNYRLFKVITSKKQYYLCIRCGIMHKLSEKSY